MKSVSFSAKAEKPKVSREQALTVARQLGCRGAHQNEDGSWMPCATMDEFDAAKKGKSAYLKFNAKQNQDVRTEIEHRSKKIASKSVEYYKDRNMALAASKRNGCSTVRIVNLGGERYYAPCVATDKFENLDEAGVGGIDTIPDGGLVSAPIGSKDSDVSDIDAKGFVNFVSRSTDPDVFSNPDSARVRARNLGCIGIRRYTANDGKTVWLPCSNGSDYNRAMNIRGDNSPRRRQGSARKAKSLGTPIGAQSGGSQRDGDGDGMIASTPGGPDDTPVRNQQKLAKGQIQAGNIDLNNRPIVKNADGTISTVRSITITEGKSVVVIPTVIKGKNGKGKVVSDNEAIAHYKKSGEHLGKFTNIPDADRFANALHEQQARQYSGKSSWSSILSAKEVNRPKKATPSINSDTVNELAVRVRRHNADMKNPLFRTNLRDIKIVYLRGLSSANPADAMKRVSTFLKAMASKEPLPKGTRMDFDLVPANHPSKNPKIAKKRGDFSDGVEGLRFKNGCCPKSVIRYHKL